MPPRRHIPLRVKLKACLDALGLLGAEIDWEHTIPLALRPYDMATGKYEPDEHDPRYLRPMRRDEHKLKTNGDHRPLSGDVSVISKTKRIAKDEEEFRRRLLAKEMGERPPKPKKRGRPFPSRPFPKHEKRT
ncbi:MAG: hypothetical protein JO255_02495 [Alphaproteobacteria bacterium]|nr:hypothetical protein [Alphaproteobacteria bacterium]